jgi:hypothetical protein
VCFAASIPQSLESLILHRISTLVKQSLVSSVCAALSESPL